MSRKYMRFSMVTLLFGCFVVGMMSCLRLRNSDQKVIKQFKENGLVPKIHCTEGSKMRYVQYGEGDVLIVFIHGAPGSSDNYYDYLMDSALYHRAVMITPDRLGYGYSEFGHAEVSIKKQAQSIAELIKVASDTIRHVVLVGHSFGGPIAARVCMDYTELVDGLVMLAPALDPDEERLFWFAYLGKYPPTRWLTPAPFRVAADEKFGHVAELQKMEPYWHKISIPVIHVHGDKDSIVPYKNLAFTNEVISHTNLQVITITEANHFIPWTNREEVTKIIVDFIEKIQNSSENIEND